MQSWPVGPLQVAPGVSTTFALPAGSNTIAATAVINLSSLLLICSPGSDGPFLCGPGGSVLMPFGAGPVSIEGQPGGVATGSAIVQYLDPDMAKVWTPPAAITGQAAGPAGTIDTPTNVNVADNALHLLVPQAPAMYFQRVHNVSLQNLTGATVTLQLVGGTSLALYLRVAVPSMGSIPITFDCNCGEALYCQQGSGTAGGTFVATYQTIPMANG